MWQWSVPNVGLHAVMSHPLYTTWPNDAAPYAQRHHADMNHTEHELSDLHAMPNHAQAAACASAVMACVDVPGLPCWHGSAVPSA